MTQYQYSESMTQVIRERVRALYQIGGTTARDDGVLAQAFEELEATLEALRVAEERLRERDETRATEQAAIEQQYQHYFDLFTHAPAGYVVTGLDGTIRQVNATAEQLLGTSERSLIGRSLANYLPDGQRRAFRSALSSLRDEQNQHIWRLRLIPSQSPPFDALVWVTVARAPSGRPQALRWLVSRVPEQPRGDGDGALDGLGAFAEHPLPARVDADPAYLEPRHQFAIVAEASVMLAAASEISTMLSRLAQMVVPTLADGCIIDLDGADGANVRLVVTRPDQPSQDGASWHARADGDGAPEALRIQWISGEELPDTIPRAAVLRALISALSPHAAIVAPLRENDRVLGSLTLISASAERPYGPAELALAEELARRASDAVTRVRDETS